MLPQMQPQVLTQKWGQGFSPAAGLLPGAEVDVKPRAGQKTGCSPEGLTPRCERTSGMVY